MTWLGIDHVGEILSQSHHRLQADGWEYERRTNGCSIELLAPNELQYSVLIAAVSSGYLLLQPAEHYSSPCDSYESLRSSGGARVFAARGKRLCCRPRQSEQFCDQDSFSGFRTSECEPTLESPPLSSLLITTPSLSSPHPTSHSQPFPLSSLKIRPLNSVRSVERCKLPSGVWGGAPAEIEFVAF